MNDGICLFIKRRSLYVAFAAILTFFETQWLGVIGSVGVSKISAFSFSRRKFVSDAVVPSVATVSSLVATPCKALTPNEASQIYDKYATSYNNLDGGSASVWLGIDAARNMMISQARGNVLEIGVGTGLNLKWYNPKAISSLTLVDISKGMLQETATLVNSLVNLKDIKVKIIQADATTDLISIFGEESFDTVVDSFSFCVMGNEGANKCLDQMSKVTKRDGGLVLLLENSRSSNDALGLYQDWTAQSAAMVGGKGCLYNQNVKKIIQQSHHLTIIEESEYAAGLFRFFKCVRRD